MAENKIVEELKKLIGKEITDTPSGVGRFLKGKLLEVDEGNLVVEFTVREEMTNPLKILHGGAMSLIIDETIGAMVYTLPTDHHYVSVNLDVAFIGSARLNEKIKVHAKMITRGRNFIHTECLVYNAKGRLIGKAQSGLIATSLPKNK